MYLVIKLSFISLQRAVFENCSCVAEKFYHHPNAAVSEDSYWSLVLTNGTASDGKCKQDCNTMPVFLVFVAIFLFLVFIIKIPTYIITLRYVISHVYDSPYAVHIHIMLWQT